MASMQPAHPEGLRRHPGRTPAIPRGGGRQAAFWRLPRHTTGARSRSEGSAFGNGGSAATPSI
jgi:hypothetical protein